MSKIEYLIWQCDTSIRLVTSLLVRNGSQGITLTSRTTLLAIMKYVSRPKIAAVKDIDIDIVGIFCQKYRYRINISKGDIDPRLLSRCVYRLFLSRSRLSEKLGKPKRPMGGFEVPQYTKVLRSFCLRLYALHAFVLCIFLRYFV